MAGRQSDDILLVRRAQQGDKYAIDRLVSKHSHRAYRFAYRLTGNSDQACDVVAEAFIRVNKSVDKFQLQSAFTTWLYRILTNCFLDLRKKEHFSGAEKLESFVHTEQGMVEREIADPTRSPYAHLLRADCETRMQKAVAKLPDYQRSIITMYHVNMMSYQEMSAELKLPVGTIKSRLNRARRSLRELLEADADMFLMI